MAYIKVILFCVKVLIALVRKKGESDIPLNNPDLLSCSRYLLLARSAWAINRWKKTRIRNLQYGQNKRG